MILGLICARHHSEGLAGKNIRPMHGTPLIEYALAKAFSSLLIDEVVVSTDIPRSAWSYAVQRIERPEHLAGPRVGKWDVWRHALECYPHADVVVDIDVTRPLTTVEDVDGTIGALRDGPVMAVTPSDKHPAFDILQPLRPSGSLIPYDCSRPYTARQQLPPAYLHGGVYVVPARSLLSGADMWVHWWMPYAIPRERAFDIDDETDWKIVEMLMAERMQHV